MARLVTIDQIEGNSNLGNPVFSNYGKMQNFSYLVMSPVKEDVPPPDTEHEVTKDNMNFTIKKNLMEINGNSLNEASRPEGEVSAQEKREQIHKILVSYFTT